jgi:multiple sugar transport system substrate-binding protein/sn-glycerol 3-phosphate transport system substrate-binding protein
MGYEYGTSDASHLASWAFAFGGDIYDYKAAQFTYNSDATVQAMTFVQDLFKSGCATIITENYGDQTDFGVGKLLFTTSSSSGLTFYQQAVASGAAFNWSVAALPHTTKDPVTNIYGASVSMPKTTPERELATWLFIKYYTSPEVQAKWAEASAYFPVRASVAANMADYLSANPAYKAGFDLLKYGKFEPPVPGYDPIRNEANTTVAAILAEPYPDVKAALDELTKKANEILSQYMTIVPTPAPTKAP